MLNAPEQMERIIRRNHGKGHSYWCGKVRYPGVTTALDVLNKPAIAPWVGRTIAERLYDMDERDRAALFSLPRDSAVSAIKRLPWAERDEAADRGTEVHEHAENIVNGRPSEVPEPLVPYVQSTVKAINDWQIRPVLTEAVVASRRWQYAGTLDLVADMKDGRRLLLDWKTTRSGIFPEVALQLAAYRYAEVVVMPDGTELPATELQVDGCAAVWIRPDGYDLVPVEAGEAQYQAFLHVLYLHRVRESMKEWVLPPVYAA